MSQCLKLYTVDYMGSVLSEDGKYETNAKNTEIGKAIFQN